MTKPSSSTVPGGWEGRIDIRLAPPPHPAHIRSTRFLAATRGFIGHPLPSVARQLPRLFSVCTTAQAVACALAGEQALGSTPNAAAEDRRARLLLAETSKEHLWRILLDWPAALGHPPAPEHLRAPLQAYRTLRVRMTSDLDPCLPGAIAPPQTADVQAALTDFTEQAAAAVFGQPAAHWWASCRDADGFLAWSRRASTAAAHTACVLNTAEFAALGQSPVSGLEPPDQLDLTARLAAPTAEAFIAAPTWAGQCRETTPFSRCRTVPLVAQLSAIYGNGLLPRWAALLVELAQALCTLQHPAAVSVPLWYTPTPRTAGHGLAMVAAARGLLTHFVVAHAAHVEVYRILAPTEWNFHPHGVVATGLAQLPAAEPAQRLRWARVYVTAIDPCVEFHLDCDPY